MKRYTKLSIVAALAALLLFLPAGVSAEQPAAPSDPVLDTLTEWSGIVLRELQLDGAPQPHRVVTALVDLRSYNARAEFGELLYEAPVHQRQGRVEVVVGDDTLDSSRFKDPRQGRWSRQRLNVRQRITVAVGDEELPLSRDLWISLDASYKDALQQWQAKVAARETLGGDAPPPDWSPAEPVVAVDLTPIAAVDAETLRRIAVEASGALWDVGGLDRGEVTTSGANYRFYTTTSEGTRLVQPEGYTVVHATAALVRDDGVKIHDELQWVVRHVSDLPPRETIVEQVRRLGLNVRERAGAEFVDYYEGPVVFEDRAAADFFRYLLTPEIIGTPPVPEAGRSYQRQTRNGPRVGRRLLPDGWKVVDDPASAPEGFAGAPAYDREGVACRAVQVVEDGYVREFLMNRVPRDEESRSNGHARGSVTGAWEARPYVWSVEAPKNLSDKAFDKALERARDRGRQDRVLVVRRMHRERTGRLPAPTLAVWRYPDGREEPIELLEFQNVDRRTLHNVAAAGGGETVLSYLAPWDPTGYPDRESGLPTVLTVPRRLLVENLELVFPGASEKPHSYPRP